MTLHRFLRFLLISIVVFQSSAQAGAHLVCLTVEEPNNYDAVNACRSFAEREWRDLGHRVTLIQGNHERPTHFEGFVEAMKSADLLVVFVRRATPPKEQIEAIRAHLSAGKPLLGIRTANHAFVPLPGQSPTDPALATWPGFAPEVLGCQNTGYETKVLPYQVKLHPLAPTDSPLLAGIDASSILGHVSLYRVLPIAADATPLLLGQAGSIEPAQPLAWTRIHGPAKARIFYTSLGAPADLGQPPVRRLIVNAVNWALAPPR
jgi:type 1 glutamine amidotransferase